MYRSQTLPPTSAVKNYSSLRVYTFRYSSGKLGTADDLSPVEERKRRNPILTDLPLAPEEILYMYQVLTARLIVAA